jgi:mono/diheme cytochrome c family protein
MASSSKALNFVSRHWRMLGLTFVAGGAMALAAVGLGALVVVEAGLFNTTASKPHNPIVSWATHATFIHSVEWRSKSVPPPPPFTPAMVQAGLQQYDADCAMCHGGPGVGRAHWVRGLTPSPPFLLDAARKWTPKQLYFILHDGAKMTAMPAWGESRSPAQLWSVVAFLEALPTMSPQQYAQSAAKTPPQTGETKPH